MKNFYSNGKLLLTAEYLVLIGAKALAIPTKYGQSLSILELDKNILLWQSFDINKNCWFTANFELPSLQILQTTDAHISKTLQDILMSAQQLNSSFLSKNVGFEVKTELSFPRNWGLGTSSTLINNIASWANVNAFELLQKSFGGSGYDIACAQHNTPITYQLIHQKPVIEKVTFNPEFAHQLYFVHLNKKQDSKKGISLFKSKQKSLEKEVEQINTITSQLIKSDSLATFEENIKLHEEIIASFIELPTVKHQFFDDYFGVVKSLGAWGGDFILATGNEDTPNYFKKKGFETIIPFTSMIL